MSKPIFRVHFSYLGHDKVEYAAVHTTEASSLDDARRIAYGTVRHLALKFFPGKIKRVRESHNERRR